MEEYLAFWMFLAVFLVLLSGFPVAFSLSGTALGFAALGIQLDLFDIAFLHALPNRLFGIINNFITVKTSKDQRKQRSANKNHKDHASNFRGRLHDGTQR